MIRSIVYIGYYLKQMNWSLLQKFMDYVRNRHHLNRFQIWWLMIVNSYKYNISLLEYFQFRFFEKKPAEKRRWAGTGYMYEYQKIMNPPDNRTILDDKRKFLKAYGRFILHQHLDFAEIKMNPAAVERLLSNPSGKIVFKVSDGKCGAQVDIRSSDDFSPESILAWMQENGFDLVEEFIIQHSELNRLSPSAVNTVRIITQFNNSNEVEILGCRLRIAVNSKVDNMAAGNLAATVDISNGIVSGPGVYSDITKKDETVHPVTGIPIVGFQIPFWDDVISMVKKSAILHPQNRSIGWDVVITEHGPGLIEGNHDWCKLLWQLPDKKGYKDILEKYKNDYLSK